MFKGRRAQAGIFTLLFFDLTFIILWALGLGTFVNTFVAQAVNTGNLVGMELFMISNLNFFIWTIFIIANLAGWYIMSGGAQ